MKKEMLINVLQPEECRIAILEDGVLEELYVERTSHESYVGNIYKGRIVNIEPSIQAAFVDFGVGRNGFLHVSDVEPAYYKHIEQGGGRGGPQGGRRGGSGGGRDRDRDRGRGGDRGGDRGPQGRRPDRPARDDRRPERRERRREDVYEELPPVDLPHDIGDDLFSPHEDVAAPPAPAVEVTPPPEAEAPHAAPAPTAEEAPPAEAPKERRRAAPRGGSRRKREEPKAEAAPEAPADDTPPDDRPRLMESAERRTEDDDEHDNGTPPPESSLLGDDDLFFFPREGAEEPAPARHEPRQHHKEEEEAPRRHEARAEEPEEEAFGRDEPEEAFGRDEPEQDDDEQAEDMAEDRLDSFDVDDLDEEDEGGGPRGRARGPGDRGDDRGPGGPRGRRGRRMGGGRPGMGRPKPLIQDIFKRGQEVIVQVIKDGIGTKGPTLSTYISIAGRCLVLMPSLNRLGVSRKIQDDEQRRRLREIVNELKPPKGVGFIIRTAAIDRNKTELQNDLAYLSRLWQVVVRRITKLKAPAEIYQESDMITRTIRDTFTKDIDAIFVDEPVAHGHAQEFLQIVMPRYASRIKLYEGKEPLFHKYGIEDEITRIQKRHVPLPHGGSIVIDQTEALVAIDVNSGNFRADNNAEETAYQMNLHAAKEIGRQLRLRDLGGVIVNDFIDMRDEKHKRAVEKAMKDAIKRDRARAKVLRMSAFGIIEMTRQRIRPSLKRSVYQDCPHCLSTGQVKTCESMSIEVMRLLQLAAHREGVSRIHVKVADDVAQYLLNKKRKEISKLEEGGGITVQVVGTLGAAPETLEFACYDSNNNELRSQNYEDERPRRR